MYEHTTTGLSCDLIPIITATALRVEEIQDALQIFWLIECGLLSPLKRPLNRRQLQCLGHGNVVVWIDERDIIDVRQLGHVVSSCSNVNINRISSMGGHGSTRYNVM